MIITAIAFVVGFLFGGGIIGYTWFIENMKKNEKDKQAFAELFDGILEIYPDLLVCSTRGHMAYCLVEKLKKEKCFKPQDADMHYEER